MVLLAPAPVVVIPQFTLGSSPKCLALPNLMELDKEEHVVVKNVLLEINPHLWGSTKMLDVVGFEV